MANNKILIVGAGLAGVNAFFALREAGYDVDVIHNSNLPMSSKIAAGTWNPVAFRKMIPSWKAELFADELKSRYQNLEKEWDVQFHGYLPTRKILTSKEEQDYWVQKSKSETSRFLDGTLITDPSGSVLGDLKEAGRMDIPYFLKMALKKINDVSKLIDEPFDFEQLKQHEDTWKYKDDTYSKVLFCEGNTINKNLFFSWVPMRPVKGQVLQVYAPSWKLDYVLKKNVFILPLGSDEYLIGATYEWDDLTWEPTQKGKEILVEKLEKVMGNEYEVVHQRAGIRPASPDRRPIIGEHPEKKGLWVFNGLGSKGVFLAPLCSKWIVECWQGKQSIPDEVDLRRWIKKHYKS